MLTTFSTLTEKHGRTVAIILVLALVVPLIFLFGTGGPGVGGPRDGGDVYGKLFGKKVTADEYRHHLFAEVMNHYLSSGNLVDLNRAMKREIIQGYAPQVFYRMRVLHLAAQDGYDQVNDQELAKYIQNQKAFQTEDKFDVKKYKQFNEHYFKDQPIQRADFDQMLRDNVVLERFKTRVTSETISDAEIRTAVLQSGAEAEYVLREFKSSDYDDIEVPEKDIIDEFENNKDGKYKIPESRKAKIAGFRVAARPEGAIEITEKEITDHYKKNLDRYKQEKEVSARHILIGYKGSNRSDATRTKKEAEKRAKDVAKKAQAKGADFAALAKEFSDGPSASKGGDLGFFAFNRMTKKFSEAAFKLKDGEVSGPVETEFGFHIIKKEAEKAEKIRPLAEVRSRVLSDLEREKDNALYEAEAQKIYEAEKKEKHAKKQASFEYVRIPKDNDAKDEDVKLNVKRAGEIRIEAAKAQDLVKFAKEINKKYEKIEITSGTRKFVDAENTALPEYIKKGFDRKLNEISPVITLDDAFYIVKKTAERDEVPFSEVKWKLISEARRAAREKAKAAAEEAANSFAAKLKEADLSKPVEAFDAMAKELKIETATTEMINAKNTGRLVQFGGISEATLHNNIKSLTAEDRVGKAFSSGTYFCIPFLVETQPSRTPELKDVREDVVKDLRRGMAKEAAQKAARDLSNKINADLAKTKKSDLLKSFREPKPAPTQKNQYEAPAESQARSLASSTNVGQIGLENTFDGAVLVYVKDRKKRTKSELETSVDSYKNFQMRMEEYGMAARYQKILEERYPFTAHENYEGVFNKDKEEDKTVAK